MKHQALFADDMIAVNIDTVEMEKGADVAMRLRGEDGGIPWSVILDADGNTLISSDGPDGNIGYPMNEGEIDYFMEMLRVARPEWMLIKETPFVKCWRGTRRRASFS